MIHIGGIDRLTHPLSFRLSQRNESPITQAIVYTANTLSAANQPWEYNPQYWGTPTHSPIHPLWPFKLIQFTYIACLCIKGKSENPEKTHVDIEYIQTPHRKASWSSQDLNQWPYEATLLTSCPSSYLCIMSK